MLESLHTDIADISRISNFREILSYLSKMNLKAVITKDILELKKIIESIPKSDYPYQYDEAFNPKYLEKNNYFCIILYQNDKVIGTYAARRMIINHYLNDLTQIFSNDDIATEFHFDGHKDNEAAWYSSLQWIDKEYRGKKIGIFLDYLKKNLIFDFFDGHINYAIHVDSLIEYHLKKLSYDHTEWLMTIKNGSIGTENSSKEKIYYVCYIDKENWYKVKDELFHNNI